MKKYEQIKGNSGHPYDVCINHDLIYYSQTETASFFNREDVTFKIVTKMRCKNTKISHIEMFLDFDIIEKIYTSEFEV